MGSASSLCHHIMMICQDASVGVSQALIQKTRSGGEEGKQLCGSFGSIRHEFQSFFWSTILAIMQRYHVPRAFQFQEWNHE